MRGNSDSETLRDGKLRSGCHFSFPSLQSCEALICASRRFFSTFLLFFVGGRGGWFVISQAGAFESGVRKITMVIDCRQQLAERRWKESVSEGDDGARRPSAKLRARQTGNKETMKRNEAGRGASEGTLSLPLSLSSLSSSILMSGAALPHHRQGHVLGGRAKRREGGAKDGAEDGDRTVKPEAIKFT